MIVQLKCKAKKFPYSYENDLLACKKISWNKKNQIIDVPKQDAEFMVATSPSDFEMIIPDDIPDSIMPDIDKDPDVSTNDENNPDEELDLECPFDDCEFVAKSPSGLKIHKASKHPKPIMDIIQ